MDKDDFKYLSQEFDSKAIYISKRYSKGNNKYLKSYDPKRESKHIIYLDANYLYGYVMSKFLPTSGLKYSNG